MKLLIVTQEADTESNTLSFFHEWISELAPNYESVEVICLREGKHCLPSNVRVHSLGKEKKQESPLVYAVRFKLLAWKLRNSYDRVFVHMNQEYVLLAGPIWMLLGKKVYLWRNHYAGSFLTDLAALFCTKIFCTSKHSYTAKYPKTVLMPVGVDTDRFSQGAHARVPRSILFLARMSPSKHPEILIDAVTLLKENNIPVTVTFVGSPLPEDQEFYEGLKTHALKNGVTESITFLPGVTHQETIAYFGSHEISVNCSRSGMFDKTLFEAAASGCIVLTSSDDFKVLAGKEHWFLDASGLAVALEYWLGVKENERATASARLQALAAGQGLPSLGKRLFEEMR